MFVKTGDKSYEKKKGLNVIVKFGFGLPLLKYNRFATPS
jgi:hypothetical protein